MLLFLDTEFTGLTQTVMERKLISLALVTEDGRAEWYAELGGWTLADCTPCVRRHVAPLLAGPAMQREDARDSIQAWFANSVRHLQVACDSEIDWHFLQDLLGCHPGNMDAKRYDLAPLMTTASYFDTLAKYYAAGNREHHALHDARAYRLGWLAWMDANKTKPISRA